MDSAVAKFLGVDECSYFRDTDFPKFHFCNGDFNPMLRFLGKWSKDERESTKMSSLTMDDVPSYVSSYFTNWSDNTIEHVSTIGNQICLSDLTIQHLASYYGHRGGKKGYEKGIGAMSAEERMSARKKGCEKGYENGIGAMSAEERMVASEKGYENGIGAMSAEERMSARDKGYENGIGAMSAEERMAKAAKWTVEIDASIERMIDDGVSFAKIASKLGNGLSKNDISNRWHKYLKKSSSIIKPAVQGGFPSHINWTDVIDATIVRMRTDGVSCAKIASKLGNGLKKADIENRYNRHLKE